MIAVIDYGMGNLGSVIKALKRIGKEGVICSRSSEIALAKKIILPGVGNYESGMKNLKISNLLKTLNQKVIKDKIPILGICLGMQIFTDWGEEGDSRGLGWISGKTVKFNFTKQVIPSLPAQACLLRNPLKIPHIGWNTLNIKNKNNPLLKGITESDEFYFLHSYYVNCSEKNNITAVTDYGVEFASAIRKENIFGVQFHPEKSHNAGLRLLKNFIENT